MRIMMSEIQIAGLYLTSSSQNWIRVAAAEISAHRVMAQLYQLFQPTAKPCKEHQLDYVWNRGYSGLDLQERDPHSERSIEG